MDYQDLLMRYMAHVMRMDGYSFVDAISTTADIHEVPFTLDEYNELSIIESLARDNFKHLL